MNIKCISWCIRFSELKCTVETVKVIPLMIYEKLFSNTPIFLDIQIVKTV